MPKILNKQQDKILMLRFYYISTNLRSYLSGNKLLYSKFTRKVKIINLWGNHSDDTIGVIT